MKKFIFGLFLVSIFLMSIFSAVFAAEEINVIYMAQAAYQPNEIRDMADLF